MRIIFTEEKLNYFLPEFLVYAVYPRLFGNNDSDEAETITFGIGILKNLDGNYI